MMAATNTPRRYAEGTDVSAEKSRADLEQLLRKHGATEVAVYSSEGKSIVMYRIRERMVRHAVEMPALGTPRAHLYTPEQRQKAAAKLARDRDAEWRRRWRALVLIVKAKLEIVSSGDSTFEREFLADMLLPDGRTVAETALPEIAASYESGAMPTLLLGAGK